MINLGKYLYNKFPDLYLSEDSRQGYALKRFFEVLGGGFDEQERYIADFSNIHNVDLCPAPLLPLLAEQYGFEFPYDMDEATQRKFIKVIPFLYQYKGTDRAFKYLAREIFGEGTVTNTYTLSPPAGVSWEEWISNPSTQQDWQKLFVKLEVNGETLFLDERVTNFSKFSELIRPVNMRVVPNLVLFYKDKMDFSNIQETYNWDLVQEDNGIFLWRFRDGSDRIGEQQLVDKLKFTPEEEPYDRTRISDFLREFKLEQGELSNSDYRLNNYGLIDYLKVNPEYETRTAIMYDEHKLDNPKTTDEEIRPNTLDDSKETLFKLKDTSEDISTAVMDDSVNTEKTTITDTDIRDKVIDDSVDKWTVNAGVDTDSFNSAGMTETYTLETFKETSTEVRESYSTADAPNNNFALKFAKLNSFAFGLGYRGQTEGVKYDDGMETMNRVYEESEPNTRVQITVAVEDEAYTTLTKMKEAYMNTNINRTRTASTLKTLNKLVTGFRLTDFVPINATLSY